jgi:hypothetical protein
MSGNNDLYAVIDAVVDGPSWNHPRSRHDPLLSSPPAAAGTLFVVVVAVMDMMQTVPTNCFLQRSVLVAI